jgi:hypothetical protein
MSGALNQQIISGLHGINLMANDKNEENYVKYE